MGLYDAVSAANDLISGVTSVAATRRESLLKQGMNAILLFIVLAVFGCLDFATLQFHPEYVGTPSFWGTILTKTVAGVCAFNIGINLMMDAEIKKNMVLAELIRKYNDLIQKKQIDFEYFVQRIFNPREKRKAYVSWINKKIYRLNRFSRPKDKLLYSSDLPEAEEKRKRNRYCIKRKELEEMKTDEFIDKNLDSVFVRYYEVDPAVFELEIDGSPSIKGVKTRGSLGVGRAKASSTVILGMIVASMFMTSFGLKFDQEIFEDQWEAFWHYAFRIFEDLAVILWQTMQGMLRVRKIVCQQLTEPYSGRVTVLTQYLEWRLSENRPDTASYKEMKPKEEVIEVTQEEFEKMKNGD